jgi:MoaA/NifB/PqqE/SkfB family radical SAM enzyme
MCNIWRVPPAPEIRPGAYRELPKTLRYVNITGGEPFMRHDLAEVVKQITESCPKADIVISTNGILTQRIREMMPEILKHAPKIGVGVSMDGIRDLHDKVRGVKGAYAKTHDTVEALKELGVTNLRIAFTATQENVSHMRRVYELSREMGVGFSCAIAHCSSHYFMTAEGSFAIAPSELRAEIRAIVKSELKSGSSKRWARAYFMAGLMQFAEGRGRMLPCSAGVDTIFVSPTGDVYPCNVFSVRMGNLSESPFADLWVSEEAEAARKRLAGCTNSCWMICSARMPMRRHPLGVMGWTAWHKLLGGRLS